MHLPHFIEKSQQFLEDHENETWLITRIVTGVLTLVLLILLGLMAYMSFIA